VSRSGVNATRVPTRAYLPSWDVAKGWLAVLSHRTVGLQVAERLRNMGTVLGLNLGRTTNVDFKVNNVFTAP
jgi:hypothetical protein